MISGRFYAKPSFSSDIRRSNKSLDTCRPFKTSHGPTFESLFFSPNGARSRSLDRPMINDRKVCTQKKQPKTGGPKRHRFRGSLDAPATSYVVLSSYASLAGNDFLKSWGHLCDHSGQ